MKLAPSVAAFAILSTATIAFGDPPTAPTPSLPVSDAPNEVVVSGPRRVDMGTSVDSIDEKQIERSGSATVENALENIPSISGGNDSRGERILTLRGFTQTEVAVFIDGVPAYLPYDGQLDLNKVPADMVSSIRVVKGAGTLIYGPNGLGGAISITTRDPTDKLSLRATTVASPFTSSRGSLVATDRIGRVGAVVGVGYQSVLRWPLSGSFQAAPNERGPNRTNSDRLSGAVASKWTFDIDERDRITVTGSVFEGRFGVPPGIRDFQVRYWRWTDWYARTVSVGHAHRTQRFEIEDLAYASFFGNTLDAYDNGQYATERLGKAFHSVYDDYAVGGVFRTKGSIPLGDSRELRVRTWSGIRHDVHAGTGTVSAPTLRASTNILTTSGQVELDVVPRVLESSAGIELDGEIPGGAPSPSDRPKPAFGAGPLLALSLTPCEALTVHASVAWRSRFPTLRERYSSAFDARRPNPSLGPEHAVNAAVDVVIRPHRSVRIALTVFDSEVSELINPVVVAPQTEQLQNISRARFLGGEAEVAASPLPWLEGSVGWTILDDHGGAKLDQPLAYRPVERGVVAIVVTPWRFLFRAAMVHTGAQDFQNNNTLQWGSLGGYQTFDLRAEIAPSPEIRVFGEVKNLLDSNVEPRFSFPEPGRQLFIGLTSRVGS